MAIQFKFRSSVNFDSVDIEGRPSISIGDLKSKIICLKKLDTCQNFDLVFSDGRTGQEFVDEKFEIPSGSCVIIKRVPAGSVPSNAVPHNFSGNFQAKDTEMVNLSHPANDPMDDFDDFGVDLYPIYKSHSSISHNNTHVDAVRNCNETEKAYLKHEGSGFSETIQGDGIIGGAVLPTNSKFIDEGTGLAKPFFAAPSVIHNQGIPSELKCILCNSFFVDAVIIRCCQCSFCEKCIRAVLMEKEKCPMCSSTKFDLFPNLSLRQTVARFLEPQIVKGDFDNACHHNASDEESVIEGKDMPCFSFATGNQEVVECIHDSSSRRNKIKVDGAKFGSCHIANSSGTPDPFDDCQGESQPVFGDVKRGFSVNFSDKNQSVADFRRHRKRDRSCYMCGSLDHFIRDCPVALNSHPVHPMGFLPGYASSWHHISPSANFYGSPMAFNTPMVSEANSYWPSIYGGFSFPSGFMMMGGMTAPPLGKSEEFICSDFLDINDCYKKMKMSNNNLKSEHRGEREDDVAWKKCQQDRDERSRSRDYRMLQERKHSRYDENAKHEIHWLNDKRRPSSHSIGDVRMNRYNERVNSCVEDSPCSTYLPTRERCGNRHRYSSNGGGRLDEPCSHSSFNHHKDCNQEEVGVNRVKANLKLRTRELHSRSESGLEQSFSSYQKLQQRETGFVSRCSKRNTKHSRDELTHNLWQKGE